MSDVVAQGTAVSDVVALRKRCVRCGNMEVQSH